MRPMVAFIVASTACFAVDPAPLPAPIRQAKTLYVTNEGIEDYIYDRVYDRLQKWPRFALVDSRKDADLVAVLTARNEFYGFLPLGSTTTTSGTVSTVGNTSTVQGSSRTIPLMVPLASNTKHLLVYDAKTGERLLTVDVPEGFLLSRTAKALVERLKGRFPKAER